MNFRLIINNFYNIEGKEKKERKEEKKKNRVFIRHIL